MSPGAGQCSCRNARTSRRSCSCSAVSRRFMQGSSSDRQFELKSYLSYHAWCREVKLVKAAGTCPIGCYATKVTSTQDTSTGKRAEILAAATERFGRDGYETTKWAAIASDVGVGPTALYHYFESKQHCLFVILDEAVQLALARFEGIAAAHPEPAIALAAIVADAFDVTPHDVQRLRVLVAEHGLLAARRASPREEDARRTAQ